MIRFCSLASGSQANATFIASSSTRLLIDNGLGVRELRRRLALIGERLEDLDAILVTHEHGDHISGVPRALKERRKKTTALPAYMTQRTFAGWDWKDCPEPPAEFFKAGDRWQIGDITVQSFTIPHDAADPVAFCLTVEGVDLGVLTDAGAIPPAADIWFADCHTLLLESNHDLNMLRMGPYPFSVKQRVMGRNGHLSNMQTADFIQRALSKGIQNLILAHLSGNNNDPAIAEMEALQALEKRGVSPTLTIAKPDYGVDEVVPVFTI